LSTSVILSAASVTATPTTSQLSRQDFHVSQTPHQEPETARASPLRLALRRLPQAFERAVVDTEFDHVVPLAAASADPALMRTWQLNHMHAFQPLCRRCHGYKCHMERQAGLYTRHLV
jgi:hypothetical protein